MVIESKGLQVPTDDYHKEEKRIGNLYGYTGGNYAYQVYDPKYLSPCLLTMTGGGECHISLPRGRNVRTS